MKIEIITRETIKPSSPTPDHLRKYPLSFLDQISPPVFMPLVFFYPSDSPTNPNNVVTNKEKTHHLKKSLSQALTQFYPLAGRVVNNLHVDCCDAGVPFVEARVHRDLSEIITDPVPGELNRFIPFELDDVRDLLMVIQVSFFNCGGLAVSVAISHKIADALSYFTFVTGWAAVARGDSSAVPTPDFNSSTLFPPMDVAGFKPSTGIVKEDIATERFVFSAGKISLLKEKFTHPTCKPPTRVEAISAFMWARIISNRKPDPTKIYTLLHAVNLRPRIEPPLSNHCFGNISRLAIAVPELKILETTVPKQKILKGSEVIQWDKHDILQKMRESIRNVNGNYVKELKEGEKHLSFVKDRADRVNKGEIVSISFSSLCRFPLYGADFGWGKPVWVGSASLTFKNLVVFLDTPSGDGIEAWVNLKKEDMEKFRVDKELLEFAPK